MTDESPVYFADVRVKQLDADHSLPAKLTRVLDAANLKSMVKGKKVAIKMHLGGNVGFTTIHPVFVRKLVETIKKAGAKSVFVADGSAKGAELRGYTRKSVGARIVGLFSFPRTTRKVPMGFRTFDTAEISNTILNADVLIVLSHVKGHGACGFGGAGKNIAMGCTPGRTRSKMHALEGGITWHAENCTHCNKCIQECPNKANKFNDKGNYEIFYHNCTFCRHCVLTCPNKALTTEGSTFADFQKGMALVVKHVVEKFRPNIFFISLLTNIHIFCDCWGFSSASLVPDIGLLASRDIVAIERATLDMIKEENYIPAGLPEGKTLGNGNHLFEKIHGKDPYVMGQFMSEMGLGVNNYKIINID
jgi:uncharacterized Fe-S center protein